MIRTASLLAVFLPLTAWAVDAQLSAVNYVNKMGTALQTLNYHGTLVYINDGQVESIELIHKNDGKDELERLVHLTGEPREVIRDNNVVTCYLPDSRSVLVGQRRFNNHLLAKLTTNLDQFAPNYNFLMAGENRVAGRVSHVIKINPKDLYRYGYRLWIDKDSDLLLRSELVDSKGDVLEQMMFTEIEIVDQIPDSMLKPAITGESFTWHGKDNKGATKLSANRTWDWKVEKMPKGFMVSARYNQKLPDSDKPAEHAIISDGLASISVYIEPVSKKSKSILGASRMGAMNIFGLVQKDHHVTIVGEVPMPTIEMIAQSIHFLPEGPAHD